MALAFTVAGTHGVNVGSNAVLDDLASFTWVAWIYPTSALTAAGIMAKGTAGGASRRSLEIRTTTVANGLYMLVEYNTTKSEVEANVLVANTWQCVAVTHDGTTRTSKLYWGNLSTSLAECTYTTNIAGVGTVATNAAVNQFLGCYGSGAGGGAGKRMQQAAIFNRVLTEGELKSWQFMPRNMSGCVGLWSLGDNGTGTQPDLSGNANAGTVLGGAQIDNAPVGRSTRRWSSTFIVPRAAALAITTQPANASDGVAFGTQPVVRIVDQNGVAFAQAGTTVTAAKQSGSGVLGGTVAKVTDASGVATYTDLAITGAGTHVLRFTAPSLTTIDSDSFTVAGATSATSRSVRRRRVLSFVNARRH